LFTFLSTLWRGGALDKFVALLQFLLDWHGSATFVAWAEEVDNYLLENGQSPESITAALEAAGPAPTSWLKRIMVAWLRWRGLHVLYRGQRRLGPYADFLSSIASGERSYQGATGLVASMQLVADLEELGVPPHELTAKWDAEPVRLPGFPAAFDDEPIGGAGIPFSDNLPVAAAYAQNEEGRVYVTLQLITESEEAHGWGYIWESERVALHRVSRHTIVLSVPGGSQSYVGPPH
jgi:hypothetical protein